VLVGAEDKHSGSLSAHGDTSSERSHSLPHTAAPCLHPALHQLHTSGHTLPAAPSAGSGGVGQDVTERFGLERALENHLVPLPAMNRDTHSSSRCSEPIQPDLGCLQGWGIHHLRATCATASPPKHILLGCIICSTEHIHQLIDS